MIYLLKYLEGLVQRPAIYFEMCQKRMDYMWFLKVGRVQIEVMLKIFKLK